jgi:hypothetical protein
MDGAAKQRGVTMRKLALLGGATAVAALCATSAMAAKDNFDRASLGKRWVVLPGSDLHITNNQLQGGDNSLGYYKKSSGDSQVSATVYLNGTGLQLGAVATGDIASGNNAYAKIQEQNGSGMFEYGALYIGNDGGGSFFQLNSPVPSPATLTLSLCGSLATMTIKSAAGKQKYTYDYGTSFPTGGGAGTYGAIALDDYRSKASNCAAAVGVKAIKITHSTAKDLSLAK